MPEPTTSVAVAEKTDKILAGLRSVPTWLFLGIAAAAAVLFSPDFAAIQFAQFRSQWGLYVFMTGALALFLGLFRLGDALLRSRRDIAAKQIVKLWPGSSQTNIWSASQQPDGPFISQVCISLTALNASDNPISLVRVEIVKPKFPDIIDSSLFFPTHNPGTPDYYTLGPRERDTAQIHFVVYGRLSESNKPVCIDIAVFDDQGTRYLVKTMVCQLVIPTAIQSQKGSN